MNDSSKCPEGVKHSLNLYVEHRLHTGGFLKAVLENDLVGAVSRADRESLSSLGDIVAYVFNELPGDCWGNPEKVDQWLSSKKD